MTTYRAEQVAWALAARTKARSETTHRPHLRRRAQLGLTGRDAPARILATALAEWNEADAAFPYSRATVEAELATYPADIQEKVWAAIKDADA
jgi:hypothetical protein